MAVSVRKAYYNVRRRIYAMQRNNHRPPVARANIIQLSARKIGVANEHFDWNKIQNEKRKNKQRNITQNHGSQKQMLHISERIAFDINLS